MLNKKDYLSKTADFVDFLVNEIDPTKKPIIFSKPNKIQSPKKSLRCDTFEDLAKTYSYDQKDLEKTNDYLLSNSKKLKKFLNINNSIKDPNQTELDHLRNELVHLRNEKNILEVCLEILRWGGVYSGAYKFAYSYVTNSLSDNLRAATEFFKKNEIDETVFRSEIVKRMNASFSKVYSICCDSPFIIFDSRVAAGFQFFATAYWIRNPQKPTDQIFDLIQFPQLPDRTQRKGISRNFTRKDDNIIFNEISSDCFDHAVWNMRANWLIGSIIEKLPKFCGYTSETSDQKFFMIRSIEAGLFQLGYNLNDNANLIFRD